MISPTIERLVGIYSDPTYQIVHYPDGRAVHFVTCVFCRRVEAGTLQGSAEGLEWGWFSPEFLPDDLLSYTRVWIQDALAEPQVVVR